ncbi:TOMM precursor leader peptide-binding protein [Streptomyces sp. HPF1205]|uniref:TOMM precursor leader peptide-binding protein n=1 Tax=Streptomyces sp. HPF1205 TaxID=2873262 RepID=UPI001CED8AE0|nr:TOMM precursor leader peptide-binding protein [Streptomyces sp. HPF1205]
MTDLVSPAEQQADSGPGADHAPGDAARQQARAYERIAGTRPRIRRDVLYTQTPTGVHFHNARGGFSVVMPSAYRFAQLIVPHLTGEHTVADLCAGLGDKQRAMVTRLVGTLYARGFARDAVPPAPGAPAPEPAVARRFAPQIDYVDHYADDAAARFLRFRTTRVAVLGEGPLARWAALSLVRNGCATVAVPAALDAPGNGFAELAAEARALNDEDCPVGLRLLDAPTAPGGYGWAELDGYDVVLVTGEHAAAQTAALAHGVPEGRMLVPAWGFGGSVVVGPLMRHGSTGCWTCAALRLGANADPAHAADLWSSLATGGPGGPGGTRGGGGTDTSRAPRGPLAAMVGNLLGYEVFRLTTGALTPETDGRLVVQDLDSLDTVAEPLLAHPRCPHCGGRDDAPATAVVPLARLGSGTEGFGSGTEGSGSGADGPGSGTGARKSAAEGPRPGTDAPGSSPADPEAASADPEAASAGPAEEDLARAALAEITDRSVLVQPASGVFRRFADETWAQTPLKVSTVELSTGHGGTRRITAFDVHHVAGARLRALHRAAEVYAEHVVPLPVPLTAADSGTAGRKKAGVEVLSVAGGVSDAPVTAWHLATSLLDGGSVLVPAAALRPFGPANRDRLVEPTAAGTGAGGTPAEATARAVLTALAHDTLRHALHGRVRVAAVDPAGLEAAGDPELTFLVRCAANLGVALEILDIGAPEQRPAPVVLARAADPATGDWHWSAAAGHRWRDAALEAVRDLLGAHQVAQDPQAPGGFDPGDPFLKDLAPAALTPTAEVPVTALLPDAGVKRAPLPATGSARPAPAGFWPGLAERLRAAGRDVLAAPVAAPDLAAGRLYVTRVLLTEGGAADVH